MTPLGIYLHIPFCTRRCDYCDFYVVVGGRDSHHRYVERLVQEIREAGSRLPPPDRRADTIYIGGGTPSLLPGPLLASLIEACDRAFSLEPGAEITLEANPEGASEGALAAWREAGINRLSLGIQDLDDSTLRSRGRLHTGEEALEAIRAGRRAGFRNISADLIAGLPGPQDPAGEDDGDYGARAAGRAQRVLDEGPDHLSAYLLETDKEAPLMQAAREVRVRLPGGDQVARAYEGIVQAAARCGYDRYEISSFSRPGMESRHNLKYWTGAPYLGFGPSSHSYHGGRRFRAPADLDLFMGDGDGWRRRLEEPDLDYTPSSREGAARESLILGLRLSAGVDLDAFDRRWGVRSRTWFEKDLAEVREAGLVEIRQGRGRLTDRGMLLANEVFSRLIPAPASAPS